MTASAIEQAITNIKLKSHGPEQRLQHALTINFHPDRLTSDGTPLLLTIANDGVLKSQFET
ncbi:hypothetical protein [Vibrio mexicanus]|uniref:hypothetical protein n=1 Tax=Vibrio mexicanus TaxID=1004326 RepID=UPI000AB2471F